MHWEHDGSLRFRKAFGLALGPTGATEEGARAGIGREFKTFHLLNTSFRHALRTSRRPAPMRVLARPSSPRTHTAYEQFWDTLFLRIQDYNKTRYYA